jgi:hypothetical protein
MKKTISHVGLALLIFTLLAGGASATTVSVGGGTFTYYFSTTTEACGEPGGERWTSDTNTFYGFAWTVNGATTSLPGTVVQKPAPTCPAGTAPTNPSISWDLYSVPVWDPPSQTQTAIQFCTSTASNCPGAKIVAVTVTQLSASEFYPTYKVVSVLYSPPGNQSSQAYGSSTTTGASSMVSSSFTFSEEMTFSSGIQDVLGGTAAFGWSTTSNNSSSFTQTWTDATMIATDDNSNTTYNPTKSDAVNHNLDSFVLWLNPQVTILSAGTTPVTFTTGSQATSGVSAVVADVLPPLPAITMEATPPGSKGVTTVPVAYLIPQAIAGENGGNSYMPGLAAICKNNTLYQEQLASSDPATPSACSQANQCGCLPSDFVNILLADPLLNYNGSTYTANPYAGTESPLQIDASGESVCAENPVPTSANCRYVAVPVSKGSVTPLFETLSGSDGVTYTVSDTTMTAETTGGVTSWNVGLSFGGGILVASLKTADTWTWTDGESTGTSSGTGNSMQVGLKTSNADCEENVNIYEDTEFHTYAFQVPTGITTCP